MINPDVPRDLPPRVNKAEGFPVMRVAEVNVPDTHSIRVVLARSWPG